MLRKTELTIVLQSYNKLPRTTMNWGTLTDEFWTNFKDLVQCFCQRFQK
jgi:hypothetical protein